MNNIEAIKLLRDKFGEDILPITQMPKAYCNNTNEVKAIYLGCDPSNKHSQSLPYAFALKSSIKIFNGFIKTHEENLNAIGLNWNSVYVQNLCQNYFEKETSKNYKVWKAAAKEYWIEHLKKELDSKFEQEIPVLLTSQYLLEVLTSDTWKNIKAPDFYECRVNVPVPAEENKLCRPLFPMYRGKSRIYKVSYHLKNTKWSEYKLRIIKYIESNK